LSVPVNVVRKQVFDNRKAEFIDEILPTLTVKRAERIRGYGSPGSDIKVGSHIIGPGSTFRLHFLRISAGSPEVWWIIKAKGSPITPYEHKGTIDVGYFEAKGGETNLMDPLAPKSIQPGTMEVWILGAGSAKWYGCAFEGLEF